MNQSKHTPVVKTPHSSRRSSSERAAPRSQPAETQEENCSTVNESRFSGAQAAPAGPHFSDSEGLTKRRLSTWLAFSAASTPSPPPPPLFSLRAESSGATPAAKHLRSRRKGHEQRQAHPAPPCGRTARGIDPSPRRKAAAGHKFWEIGSRGFRE